jgi:hypothetical protein
MQNLLHHGDAAHNHSHCHHLPYAAKTLVEYEGGLMAPVKKARHIAGVILDANTSDMLWLLCRASGNHFLHASMLNLGRAALTLQPRHLLNMKESS